MVHEDASDCGRQTQGRTKAGLGWTKYARAAHPPEKEPPYPAVDGLGVTFGRELFDPRDQATMVG